MSQFLSSFIVRQWKDGIHWSYAEPMIYSSDKYGAMTIPFNFSTDGGSGLRAIGNIINPYGKGFRAFGLHDMLYYSQMFTRDVSDEILREALMCCGENALESDVQFTAVRLAGEIAWDEHTRNGDPEKFKRGIYPMENNT